MSGKDLRIAALAVAVVLVAACGGDGEPDTPDDVAGPPPAPPTSPSPTPSPAPTPGPVVANAGPDLTTVARQGVLVDGSGTRDAENDPITYSWQLVSAPAGSGVRVQASTPTFDFVPDIPGTYELRLTAKDAQGSSSDATRVVVDPLLSFGPANAFDIKPSSAPGSERTQLTLNTSPHYRGAPVAVTATSNVPWLRVSPPQGGASAAAGKATSLDVQLELTELAKLPNGQYTARVTATPGGGHAAITVDVPLSFVLPHVRTVVPYVAYAGQPSRVTLYGDDLGVANGRPLLIGGAQGSGIAPAGERQATADLPALAPGRYTVRIANDLGIVQEMGWVVVREPPRYAEADVPLPGFVETMEMDAERDAFYGLFSDRNGTFGAYRIRLTAGTWQVEQIGVEEPGGLRLTVDGRELLVASGNCTIVHLDPETLGRLRSTVKPSCANREDDVGDVLALADSRIFVVEEDQGSRAWTYPEFRQSDLLPNARRPVALVSYERNRVVWAEKPQGNQERRAWTHGLDDGRTRRLQHQGASTFEITNLAVSGNGRRLLHRSDLYDDELRYLGRLSGVGDPAEIVPGLNRAGTRSVVVDATTNAIVVNDLTAPGLPVLGTPIFLPHDTQDDSVVLVSPDGATAFAFTTSRIFVFTLHALYVRSVPAS